MQKLIIGTRGSALALRQTEITRDALLKVEPGLEVEVRVIKTEGDVNQNPIPLDTVGKGWFTKEIEEELLAGRIDIAVHSLKDMETEAPDGLVVGAYLEREDARDVLVSKDGMALDALRQGAVVGTDSARRQVQTLAMREDLKMQSLRGNVPTRLKKLEEGAYDAVILAAAGLKRLGLEQKVSQYFSVEEITPAPGQGILAIQMKEGGGELAALVGRINDAEIARTARIERDFSRAVGGGCKAPVGAYAWRDGDRCLLVGMLEREDGSIAREETSAPWDASDGLGATFAQKLLAARHEKVA